MRRMGLMYGLLILVLWASGVHGESVPGVTDDAIRVGLITDLTGPLAFIGQEESAGVRLYFRHINDNGGIHGRKLELRVEDDGYRPPRSIAAFRKLVERDRIFCFAGNLGTSTVTATLPLLERERIPLIAPLTLSSTMHTPTKRYVFAIDPSYDVQSWIIVKYILETGREASARLAVLYQDDDAGHDGLKGLRQAAAYHGLPIVAEESYKRGAVDFTTQVLNLQRADPTHVVLIAVYREAAAVLREARRTNWRPRFMGWTPAAVDKVVSLAGKAAEGYLAVQYVDFSDDGVEMGLYRQLLETHAPDRSPAMYHAFGFWIAEVLVEGLQRAGRDLTREGLVEALETLEGWDASLGPPLTYGPGLRGGRNTAAFLARADVKARRMVRATDWIHFEMPNRSANDR